MNRKSIGRDPQLADGAQSPLVFDELLSEAVQRVRAGVDIEASFQIIDARLRPRLLRYFRSNPISSGEAEDLVQKTLTRVFLAVGQLEQDEKFLPWLFAIARNVKFTQVKNQQQEGRWLAGGIELVEELPNPVSTSSSDDRQLDEVRLAAVQAAIEKLPAQQRQCLLLRVREELSYEEIAGTLRLSVNTVRNHLAEAKRNLRRVLQSQGAQGLRE